MNQDSRQVLGDEIGRILSEAGVTPEQADYLRTGFVEMIQKNTMILETTVSTPGPVENPVQRHNIASQGVAEIARMMIAKNIFKYKETKVGEETHATVAVHLIRNAGI